MNIIEELQWRGLIADQTDAEGLAKRLAEKPITLYAGFDPTADSLHVGSLVPLLGLRRFQQAGHFPIAVAGGATGSIGDPSGKSAERSLLTKEQIQANVDAVRPQLARLLDFETQTNPAILVDNADWTAQVSFLDFLRDIGKHFTVNQMVAKESVRARMEDREVGISYTEFSYQLLQAFDFYHLNRKFDCELQIGGSDQWGNITAGIDLLRKKGGHYGYGVTLPLITKADGTKFGKTESGTVWLDAKKTSPYQFFQFWMKTDDRDVIRYLKLFTFLTQAEITDLEAKHTANPGAREAHHHLAMEMTRLIHGNQAAEEAYKASLILFGGNLDVAESTFYQVVGEVPSKEFLRPQFEDKGSLLLEVLVFAGLETSKGQARKDVESGGVYVNNHREADIARMLTTNDLLFGKYILLRKGKRNYFVVKIVEEPVRKIYSEAEVKPGEEE